MKAMVTMEEGKESNLSFSNITNKNTESNEKNTYIKLDLLSACSLSNEEIYKYILALKDTLIENAYIVI